MKSPAHPGAVVKSAIDALSVTYTLAAEEMGITRQTLCRIMYEQARIRGSYAVCIERFFQARGCQSPDADLLVRMQIKHDLAQELKEVEDERNKGK